MKFDWVKAKEKYQEISVPKSLDQVVDQAIHQAKAENMQEGAIQLDQVVELTIEKSKCRQRGKRWFYSISSIAATAAIVFVVGVNTSVAFAQSVSDMPILGQIAKVVMTDQIKEELASSKIDVKIPAVVGLSDAEFEKRMNEEIQTRVKAHVATMQQQADEFIQARIETGMDATEAGQVDIIGDYLVYYKGVDKVSFKIDIYSNQGATGWNEVYLYNLDILQNKELKLSDLFIGDSYIATITDEVKRQMEQRIKDGDFVYWIQAEDYEMGLGFKQIQADQTFHFNEAGDLVIYFAKYEVSPGYMGAQEFIIPQDLIRNILK